MRFFQLLYLRRRAGCLVLQLQESRAHRFELSPVDPTTLECPTEAERDVQRGRRAQIVEDQRKEHEPRHTSPLARRGMLACRTTVWSALMSAAASDQLNMQLAGSSALASRQAVTAIPPMISSLSAAAIHWAPPRNSDTHYIVASRCRPA